MSGKKTAPLGATSGGTAKALEGRSPRFFTVSEGQDTLPPFIFETLNASTVYRGAPDHVFLLRFVMHVGFSVVDFWGTT